MRKVAALAAWCLLSLQSGWAQDTTWTLVARFADAHAVAISPAGIIYVADVADDVVYRVTPDDRTAFGGPGIAAGQFDDPVDVDATNGMVLAVADAGNGRIQRFSREPAFLGSLRTDEEDSRLISVSVGPDGQTFAIDASQNVIVGWDSQFRLLPDIGGYREGEGALARPVALTAGGDERLLYVLDQEVGAVLRYDMAGAYAGRFGNDLQSAINIHVSDDRVYVVLPNRVRIFTAQGTWLEDMQLELDGPLRDFVRYGDRYFALTSRALYCQAH